MALVISNPDNVPGEVTSGYQQQNTVLYASMTGFMNINFRNNRIASGSIFEYLGNLIKVTADEDIQNVYSMNNGFFYIYAYYREDGTVSFIAKSNAPEWNSYKNGYYLNNNGKLERALIRAIRDLDSNSIIGTQMNNILNNEQGVVPPNNGGIQVYTKNTKGRDTRHFDSGWYRFVIQSGLGLGNGRDGESSLNHNPPNGAGGVSSISNSINGVFYHSGGVLLINVGGNGFSGGSGGMQNFGGISAGGVGGGGGSGAGEESYIISGGQKYEAKAVYPGKGGDSHIGYSVPGGGTPGGIGTLSDVLTNTFRLHDGNGGDGGATTTQGNQSGSSINYGKPGLGNGGDTHGDGNGGAGAGYGGGGGASPDSSDPGSSGGGGGAPGWFRPNGSTAAGYVTIWSLGQ
jgi:hypothetical protein